MKLFKEQAKKEDQRFLDDNDSEFWFAVCFQSREQKEAFLAALGWAEFGDKYLSGRKCAKKQGVDLPPADEKFAKRNYAPRGRKGEMAKLKTLPPH